MVFKPFSGNDQVGTIGSVTSIYPRLFLAATGERGGSTDIHQ